MITKEQARLIVENNINKRSFDIPVNDKMIILNDATIEKPWGWVFFYTSKTWHETGDDEYAVAGNTPIIIEKATGRLIETGTAYPVEHYIQEYESQH